MVGKPKYNYGDKVEFEVDDKLFVGEISIIDSYGIFGDDSEVYYDILSTRNSKPCLYKHVIETLVKGLIE